MLCCLFSGIYSAASELTLVGWGMDKKNPEKFFKDAAEVGFDVIITWSNDRKLLETAVKAAQKHNIKVFACIAPMGRVKTLWKKQYPQQPVPWQVMNDAENAAYKFIFAGKNKTLIPYQWGGEPVLTNEVLQPKIICFNNSETRELFKPVIDEIISVPGLEGLAFDGFGYQNYYACHCEKCRKLLKEYQKKHPEVSAKQAEIDFFRSSLVNYINHLADYARSKKADIKTTIHIWPVFSPDPLYGNRLNIDYCGQTAAWYTIWPEEKIVRYSKVISGQAKKYYKRQEGVGMIGYYDRPGTFPVKSAPCVEMELRAMLDNGCRRIQVCGAKDVIKNKEVAAVFKKIFKD
jgi:hypothetical protein